MTSRIASHLSVPFTEGRRPWGKGSDMIGRNRRSPHDGHKVPICRKVFVAALSLSLITSGVPAPAWAQALDDAQGALAQAAAAVSDAREPHAGADAAVAAGGLAAGEFRDEAPVFAGDAVEGGESAASTSEPATSERDDASVAVIDDAVHAPAASGKSAADAGDRAALNAECIYIHGMNGKEPSKVGNGTVLRADATYVEYDDLGTDVEVSFSDNEYDGMAFQWYIGDHRASRIEGAEAPKGYAPIEGATDRALTVPDGLIGKFIAVRIVNPSGSILWSDPVGPVAAMGSAENEAKLAAAIAALEKDSFSGYSPAPVFGRDSNLNDMIEANLEKLGVTGVASHVVSSGMEKYEPAARGSIDTTDGASNGDIEFFFLPPVERTGSTDYTVLRRFQPTYRLTCGDATDTFTPERASQLPWDDARVEKYLTSVFDNVELPAEFAQGSVPEAVKKLELPFKVVDAKTGKTVASIEWASSNAKVAKVASSYNAASVSFTHPAAPADVVLTATLKMAGASDLSLKTIAVERPLSVEPRSGVTTQQIKDELSSRLAEAEAALMGGDALDPAAVTGDLILPNPRALGIDGRVCKLSYESSDPAVIRVNTYCGVVTRTLEGEEPRSATITARLAYEDVTVTRELGTFTPAVVTNAEIDAAIDFMGRVKAGYAAALLGANASPDEVMADLDTFQSASPASDGSVAWARTFNERDDAGVVPVDLPGYDPMGTAQWRLFRSSRPTVVAHENLLVTQPAYNTKVRIDSMLTYKAFESLAAAHPQNAKLQQLVNQPVSAMFTVLGTTGAESPEAGRTLTVNARVTGLDAVKDDGTRERRDWIPLTEVTMPVDEGATAWDVFAGLLDEAGYTYTLNAAGPISITTPEGVTLDSDFNQSYRYWAFFIDGKYGQGAEGAATTCPVKDGMTIELRYLDEGATTAPSAGVEVNPDAEHPNLDAQWNGFINGGAGSVTEALTPTEAGELAWAENLRTPEEMETKTGIYASDPLIIGGKIYIVTASFPKLWTARLTSASLARLQVRDRETGKVEREVALGTAMNSTCRPVYADGIIVVPLAGGFLQAVSAKTLETMWVAPAYTEGESASTLTVEGDYVYAPTFGECHSQLTHSGSVRRYNLHTGALAGAMDNEKAGYYWAGGVAAGDFFVIGDDSGVIRVFTADLTNEVSSIKLSDTSIRSSLVYSNGYIFAVTHKDGTLHKLKIDDAGKVTKIASARFADESTSTPAICGGRAFIGGVDGDYRSRNGVLAVIDLATMKVQKILAADGGKIPGEIKSAPLVSVQGGETYVYFTLNLAEGYPYTSGGCLYRYRLGDSEASVLFQPGPGQIEFCMASVICDEEGNLYYTNDSGHLFKIAGNGPAQGGGSGGGETGGDGGSGDGGSGGGETGGNSGQTGGGETGGNGSGGQTDNGGQAGGDHGGGQSDSNSGAGTSGDSTTGNTNSAVPPSKTPVTGSVPAGAAPIARGVSDKKDASQRDAAADSDFGDKSQTAGSVAVSESASTVGANAAHGMSLPARVAFAAGVVGVAGLVASGLWMALSRRR